MSKLGQEGVGLSLFSLPQVEQSFHPIDGSRGEDENDLTLNYFDLKGSFSNIS